MSDRAVTSPTQAPRTAPAERCDICGALVIEVKCKIICKNCGYTRDCSDP